MPGFGYGRARAVGRALGQQKQAMRPASMPQAPQPMPGAQPMAAQPAPAIPQALPQQAAPMAQERFGMRPQLNQGVPLTGDAIRMQEQQRALNGRMTERGKAMDELFNRRMV